MEVCEFGEDGGSDAAHAEGKSEEKSGDHADAAGDEFLGVDEDGGKRRGDDEADDDGEDPGPEEVGIRQEQGEGQDAEDGAPDNVFAAEAIADGATEEGAGGGGSEEGEEVQLRALDGDVEAGDQVEGVVAGEAGQVEIFREDQRHQDAHRNDDLGAREVEVGDTSGMGGGGMAAAARQRPVADAIEDDDADEGEDAEPCHAVLAARQDDEGGEQGTDGTARAAAYLEEGLGEAVLAAGGHAGDAGGFGMEDGGPDSDERSGEEQPVEGGGEGEQEQSGEGDSHADGQGVGRCAAIREVADEGLQQRGGDLVDEGNDADLAEVEVERTLEDG